MIWVMDDLKSRYAYYRGRFVISLGEGFSNYRGRCSPRRHYSITQSYLNVDFTIKFNVNLIVDIFISKCYIDQKKGFGQKEGEAVPKVYSPEEREYIITRLKEEAADCLSTYGVRKTTVDELVRRVNIPKGTFYLFYKSKELLLFEVIQEQHDAINKDLEKALAAFAGKKRLKAEELTDMIYMFFKKTEEMPILRLLDTAEVDLLVKKLPREVVEAHFSEDTDTIEKMISMFPTKEGLDVKVVSAAFHAIYFATLHKEEIGGDNYDEALRSLIYGIVIQMLK